MKTPRFSLQQEPRTIVKRLPLLLPILLAVTVAEAQAGLFTYEGRIQVGGSPFDGTGQFKFALVTSTNLSRPATATATISGGFLTIATVTDGGAGYVSPPAVTVVGGGGAGAVLTANVSGGAVISIAVNNPGSGYSSPPSILIAPPPDNLLFTTYWSNDGSSVSGSEPTAAVAVPVKDGLFSVALGDTRLPNMNAIDEAVFLQERLQVRLWFNDGVNGFAALHPPQDLTPAPYAIRARSAASADEVSGPIDGSAILAGTITGTQLASGAVTAINLASNSVTASQLSPGAAAANLAAGGQTAVPSGGIVLSSNYFDTALVTAGYGKVGRADLGDVWERRESGVPVGRHSMSAVWTGSEFIIWGGLEDTGPFLNTGSRYDPARNSWRSISTNGAPTPRSGHSAIWTGSEMIVWGGSGPGLPQNTGGRYNPITDQWTPLSTVGAPAARSQHKAIWTGTEMIVWGGFESGGTVNTGAKYNPATDTWSSISTSGAPLARFQHQVVWTGSEMLVWGGIPDVAAGSPTYNNGGLYNPLTDTWRPVASAGAPEGRYGFTGVWTGSRFIVWGGIHYDGSNYTNLNTGGSFNPVANSWSPVATASAPLPRYNHAAVWTGNEMIVWGGFGPNNTVANDGARFNPASNTWTVITPNNAPPARTLPVAAWTGSEMVVWGGNTFPFNVPLNDGGRYDPLANSWKEVAVVSPQPRYYHTAVWTGSEMLVWGGTTNSSSSHLNTGGRYNPVLNSWSSMTTNGAPSGRYYHSAVWTGTEMIIWGGWNGVTNLNDGARYNPALDLWTALPGTAADRRRMHTAVWTGAEMIIWGGLNHLGSLNSGTRYDLAANSWTAISTALANTPPARYQHTAIWTGNEMIIWGGFNGTSYLNTGGRYSPSLNAWVATPTTGDVPQARALHTAVWTGNEMILWGGFNGTTFLGSGGRLDPIGSRWWTVLGGATARSEHSAVWTGSEMVVWGGRGGGGSTFNSGSRYDPLPDHWTVTSMANGPAARWGQTVVWTGSEMLLFGGTAGPVFGDIYSYTPKRELYLYQRP